MSGAAANRSCCSASSWRWCCRLVWSSTADARPPPHGDAEAVAAGAARAGLNAGATGRLAGRANTTAAVSAARSFLAGAPNVSGSVQLLPGGRLRVTTQSTTSTRYLSIVGINTVTGRGEATADLIESGGG